MKKANLELRMKVKEAKIPWWAIADNLKLTEPNMSRKLRYELTEVEKNRIYTILEKLKLEEGILQ